MWSKFSRRRRHAGKRGYEGMGALAPLGELLGESPRLPVHARVFSESTEAWLRQMAELDAGTADDCETDARALLDQAALLRRRVADVRAYLDGGPSGVPLTDAPGVLHPGAEVKHWVDGSWQTACGDLSGLVAESRDAVTCPGCRNRLETDASGLVDTATLRRHHDEPRQVGVDLWRAQQPGHDEQLHGGGRWAPAEDDWAPAGSGQHAVDTGTARHAHRAPARDGDTREMSTLGGAA